jgi:2-polyprenyl-3-methyl-5-hydroxy-6-metoxy-1,4-benzoquinol methylase
MEIEQNSQWYDDNIWNTSERMLYNHKGGLYLSAYELSDGKNIIDVGCGSGRLAHVFRENGFDGSYLGIDFSKNAIDYCRRTYPYEFKQYNIFDVSYENYDNIVCLEVLEHINDDIKFISIIPKSKVFIFSVPNFGGISHVRYFSSIMDVKERYNDLLDFVNESQIDRLFLFKTLKK